MSIRASLLLNQNNLLCNHLMTLFFFLLLFFLQSFLFFSQIHQSDEITAIAMHPNGRVVATGERGRVPKIMVWDVATCQTICVIRGFHERGISQLTFSTSGDVLISVGMDEYNTVALYVILLFAL